MPSVRIAVDRQYGIPLRDGYDYITDPERWPEYWPNLIRVAPGARWSAPGDVARLTMKLLGRATELEMTLARIEPYRLVEYTSRQRGLPDGEARAALRRDRRRLQLSDRASSSSLAVARADCSIVSSSPAPSSAPRGRRWTTSSGSSARAERALQVRVDGEAVLRFAERHLRGQQDRLLEA